VPSLEIPPSLVYQVTCPVKKIKRLKPFALFEKKASGEFCTGKSKMDKLSRGHRERLRARFLAGEAAATADEGLLELLLTFAIPRRDVSPIAACLMKTFGQLGAVLRADPAVLSSVEGLGPNSIALLKLVGQIAESSAHSSIVQFEHSNSSIQPKLFNESEQTESGNPGGRPRKDLASIIADQIFAENPEAIKAALVRKLKQHGDPALFKALADRAFGRLPQPVEHSGNDGRPIEIIFGCEMPPWAKSNSNE